MEAPERPPWTHTHNLALDPPRPRPVAGFAGDDEDHRWFPPRPRPPGLPDSQAERTRKATSEQCLNARMPGYTGRIPSSHAEGVYGRSAADAGRVAWREHSRRQLMRTQSLPAAGARPRSEVPTGKRTVSVAAARTALGITDPSGFPEAHPMGQSRATVVKGHWVPTIPGYGGHIPGKYAENVVGGGMLRTCQQAGRAIAERSLLSEVPADDSVQRSLASSQHDALGIDRVATHVRAHCERSIPGYMGYIPRVHVETICGSGHKGVARMAADFVEDRLLRPENHISASCATRAPMPRKLRV